MSDCKHEHMRFSEQGRTITCIDCPQRWQAVTAEGQLSGPLKLFGSGQDTRHGMFTIPRTKPKTKPQE